MSKTVTFTARINAPVDRVYALFASAERIPEWFPRARAVENATASMLTPGARFTIRFRGRPDANEEVLEVEPNALHRRQFVQAQGGLGAWGKVIVRFRTVEGGTEIEENIEYGFQPGILAPLLSAMMDAQARRAMGTELEAFKAFVEREVSKTPGPQAVPAPRPAPSSGAANGPRA